MADNGRVNYLGGQVAIKREEGGALFKKLGKKDQRRTGRETQRYPHFSPGAQGGGRLGPHFTDIRLIKTSGRHDIYQRYHQLSDTRTGNPTGGFLHDRIEAVNRLTGSIHGVKGGKLKARSEYSLPELRKKEFTVGLQKTEYKRASVMSKTVMRAKRLGYVL